MDLKDTFFILCSDLNDLLEDICRFLNNEMKFGNLPQTSNNIASFLLQRSKVQLNEISKIISENNWGNACENDNIKKSDKNVHENIVVKQKIAEIDVNVPSPIICPYLHLPAFLITDEKCGYLERKEKIFLSFLEHQKILYAGIYNGWLLLYNCKNNHKPFAYYYLKLHEAKLVENMETTFEVKSKTTEKSEFFTATTKTDTMLWVNAINKINQKEETTPLKSPIEKTLPDNIYEEIGYEIPITSRCVATRTREKLSPFLQPKILLHDSQRIDSDVEDKYVTILPDTSYNDVVNEIHTKIQPKLLQKSNNENCALVAKVKEKCYDRALTLPNNPNLCARCNKKTNNNRT